MSRASTLNADPQIPNPKSQIPTRFLFYGGKGGAGKTTCAAARAAADAAAGARVLIVSTDPAHSLGDALGVSLSARPKSVRLVPRHAGRLDAVELDAPRAFARWIATNRGALGDILEHGTWLDRDDVEALLDLSIPGVDELMGLIEIDRLAERHAEPAISERESLRSSARSSTREGAGSPTRRPRWGAGGAPRVVIIDTAPTGHALRLLAAPDAVATVADVLASLQQEHRLIREQFARVARPEAADRFIALLAAQAHDTAARLRDRTRTMLHWVTLPEPLSIAESEDALASLETAGLAITEIIVNCVLPPGDGSPRSKFAEAPCPVCDRRRAAGRIAIETIRRTIGRGRRVRLIPAQLREPRGVKALSKIGQKLRTIEGDSSFDKPVPGETLLLRRAQDERRVEGLTTSALGPVGHARPEPVEGRVPRGGVRSLVLSVSKGERAIDPASLDAFRGARLLFFGGKGGVGKTTVAAAAALSLARANPAQRLLLLSTDPAHSLGDVFNAALGDEPTHVKGAPKNLAVRELDAARALARRRRDLKAAVDEIAATVGAAEISTPAGGASELMNLAPPGVDELFGLLEVMKVAATPEATRAGKNAYDLVVVDTAPTGHALRLLELPEAARDWVQVLLRLLLKYRSLVRPGQLAAELVDVSKSIRDLQALLHDPDAARFIVVTRAADVPRAETARLLDRLRQFRLATPAIVVNAMTLAPGACRRCRGTAAAERVQLAALRRQSGRRVIIHTPLSAPPPRGVPALDRWAQRWILDRAEGTGFRAKKR